MLGNFSVENLCYEVTCHRKYTTTESFRNCSCGFVNAVAVSRLLLFKSKKRLKKYVWKFQNLKTTKTVGPSCGFEIDRNGNRNRNRNVNRNGNRNRNSGSSISTLFTSNNILELLKQL